MNATVACLDGLVEARQPGPGLGPPRLAGLIGEADCELGVACDRSGAEQRRGGLEVVGGQIEGLAHGPHCVAELRALVPQRIPERTGDRLDVVGPLVDQEEVEIAVGTQLAAPVAAHRDERHVVAMPDGVGVEGSQPGIDRIAQGCGEHTPCEAVVCDDVGSRRAQRHGRFLRFCSAGFTDTASLYGRLDTPTEPHVQIDVRHLGLPS
jgi:hypothetical protein